MNLIFKKKKNKSLNEKLSFNIQCPFCFKKFSHCEIVFRATHYVNDDPEYCLQEDENLEKYRKKMDMEPIGELEAVINPKDVYEENRVIIKGVYKQIRDKYGYITRRRLCPYCHNELPPTSVKGPSITISIIGSSKVGKSSFMAALLHEMQTSTAKRFNSECIASGDKYKEILKRNIKKIFENGEVPDSEEDKTGVMHMSLYWRFNDDFKEALNIIFYDVDSEAMINENYLELYAQNIKYSDGIIFLVDHVNLDNVRKELKLSDFVNQRDIISNLYNDYIVKSKDMSTDVPTALVITKSDTILNNNLEIIDSKNMIFDNYIHKDELNIGEFIKINEQVRNFIKKTDFPFFNTMETYFSNLGYFAVSSFGPNYKKGNPVKSIRIDEPLLWILFKLGYIKGV